jgi:parallel beta-helix repeat protein
MGAVEGVSQRFPRPFPVVVMPNDAPNALKTGAFHVLKGDGTDGDELNNLLADRQHVQLGPGTVTATGIAPPAGAALRGSGLATVLFVPNASPGRLFTAESVDDVELADFAIAGNAAHQSGTETGELFTLVHFSRCARARVRGLRLTDAYKSAIVLYGCDDALVSGCHVAGAGRFGVFVGSRSDKGSTRVRVERSTADACGAHAFCADGGYGLEVSYVVFRDLFGINATGADSVSAGNGIHVEEGVRNFKVLGCTASGNLRRGIYVGDGQTHTPCYDGLVQGNQCRSNGLNGIHLSQLHQGRVQDNRCALNTEQGIRAEGCRNVAIDGNDAGLNTRHGIYLLNSAWCVVENNTVRANSQESAGTYYGIAVDDTNAGTQSATDNRILNNRCYDDQANLGGADASMTAGSDRLTFATARPVPDGLVGKAIQVNGAGAAGVNLVTTVRALSPDGPGVLLLTVAASTTVSGATWAITRPKTQGYGARILASVAQPQRTFVDGNDLRDNLNGPFHDLGNLTEYGRNYGLENWLMVLDEDFASGGSNATTLIGASGWTQTVTGSGTGSNPAQATGHPGIVRRDTGATAGSTSAIAGGPSNDFHCQESWDVTFWFRANQANADADAVYRFGVCGVIADPPVHGCFFERLGGESNLFAVSRASSVQTRADMGVAQDNGWHVGRIRRSVKLGVTIDGGADVDIATNVPSGQGFIQFLFVGNGAAAASKTIDLDRARLVIPGLATR